jgi:lipopolysaccharide assembly outer membrane protein LptD (OstA)
MFRKLFIQGILLIFIILVTVFTYIKYIKQETQVNEKTSFNPNLLKDSNNLIKDISYESTDDKGRKYLIESNYGRISKENFEIIIMTNVTAKIILVDKSIIFINSDNAEYNNKSNNTSFENNVKLEFLDHKLSSNKLNIFFEKNLLEAYGDLVYENSDIKLNAERLDMDLISKNSKVYNLDNSNVVIETINK